jgi:hypothetical protein
MRHYRYRLLDEVGLTLDDRNELEARRDASERRLVIDQHEIDHEDPHDYEYDVHLLDPRTATCIAVRKTWAGMRAFVDELSPIALRKLIERARPCAVHPPPITPDDDTAP